VCPLSRCPLCFTVKPVCLEPLRRASRCMSTYLSRQLSSIPLSLVLRDSGVDDGVALGIERDDLDGLPVACVSSPAARIGRTRFGIQLVPSGEDGAIFACMALSGAHVADPAVPVVMVIPINKVSDPTACVVDVGKPLRRELGS